LARCRAGLEDQQVLAARDRMKKLQLEIELR
jgi:hypothetical protein